MRGSRSPPRATNSLKPYGRERGLDGCASLRAEEGQEALCELWVRHIRLTCCSRARGGQGWFRPRERPTITQPIGSKRFHPRLPHHLQLIEPPRSSRRTDPGPSVIVSCWRRCLAVRKDDDGSNPGRWSGPCRSAFISSRHVAQYLHTQRAAPGSIPIGGIFSLWRLNPPILQVSSN